MSFMKNLEIVSFYSSTADTLSEVDAKRLGDSMANFEVMLLVEKKFATHSARSSKRPWLTRSMKRYQ